jgi:vitamin B12 transporter
LKFLLSPFLLLAFAAAVTAAPDAWPIIDVTASRLDSQPYLSPYGELSVAEEAASIPGVRLQRQGLGSPQADLRIRGGAFSSSGFALEGLPLFDPQTEHFHADLPLSPLLADRVRLLTGLEQFSAMSGHASGTVDMDLAEPDNHLKFDLAAGSDGFFAPAASAGWAGAAPGGGVRGGSAFLQHDRIDRTDGQDDNDLTRWTGGGLLQQTDEAETLRSSILASGSSRRFGARGFYGAPATFASEEEVESHLLLGSVKDLSESTPSRLTAAWRQSEDRYWLDRHDKDLYENHHETESFGLHGDSLRRFGESGSAALRGDYLFERIDSDYRGRLPGAGLGRHSRQRFALGALPGWTLGDLTLSAGGAGEWFDTDKPAWLPGAGASWQPSPHQNLFAAVTTAVRQPSYTELNYESPGSLGNQDLERQESVRLETGWRLVDGQTRAGVLVFEDHAKDVVDWIRLEAAGRWTAVNLDSVTTRGALLHGSRAIGDRWSLNGEYLGLDKEADDSVYSSRYALDYARHEFRAGVRVDPARNWRVGLWQTAAFYAGNPSRSGSDTRLESNFEVQVRLPRPGLVLSAGVANLWDRDFETLPGQPEAGRQGYCSLSLVL